MCNAQRSFTITSTCAQPARQPPRCRPAHLYHEVLDAPVEDGAVVVAHLRQCQEVLTGAGHDVRVELHVDVAQGGVQPQVRLLAGVAVWEVGRAGAGVRSDASCVRLAAAWLALLCRFPWYEPGKCCCRSGCMQVGHKVDEGLAAAVAHLAQTA
jgi:hypothetical protein